MRYRFNTFGDKVSVLGDGATRRIYFGGQTKCNTWNTQSLTPDKISRRISANIRFRVCSMKNDSDELWSEIHWAQFFSDKNRTKLLYETPKPPPAAPVVPDAPKSDVGSSGDNADG